MEFIVAGLGRVQFGLELTAERLSRTGLRGDFPLYPCCRWVSTPVFFPALERSWPLPFGNIFRANFYFNVLELPVLLFILAR